MRQLYTGGRSFLLVFCRGVASLVSCGAPSWNKRLLLLLVYIYGEVARVSRVLLSISSSSSLLPLPHVSVHHRTIKGLPSQSHTPVMGEPNPYRHFLFISPIHSGVPSIHHILEGRYEEKHLIGLRLITKTENKTFFFSFLNFAQVPYRRHFAVTSRISKYIFLVFGAL